MSRGLACCINPQAGGPGDEGFLSLALDMPVSDCTAAVLVLVHPGYFISPVPHHIWCAFPYPPPGEAPDGRLATSHCISMYKTFPQKHGSFTNASWDINFHFYQRNKFQFPRQPTIRGLCTDTRDATNTSCYVILFSTVQYVQYQLRDS